MKKRKKEIEEKIISFRVEKILLEKGFTNNVMFYKDVFRNYVDSGGNKTTSTYSEIKMVDEYERPTISLAQKWLRDKHYINVIVFLHPSDKFSYNIFDKNILSSSSVLTEVYYNTYEYALEEGIYEALKLIKDEK